MPIAGNLAISGGIGVVINIAGRDSSVGRQAIQRLRVVGRAVVEIGRGRIAIAKQCVGILTVQIIEQLVDLGVLELLDTALFGHLPERAHGPPPLRSIVS